MATAGIGAAPYRVRAGVAELVDALDLGSSIERCGGSSPFARTSPARPERDGSSADRISLIRRPEMQTVETLNEGLRRAYRLTITAKDIDARVDQEL